MFLQRLSRMAGPALLLGGLLWITVHVIVVIAGLMTGRLVIALPSAQQPLLAHIYYLILSVSYLILCVGLLGGFARLKGNARGLGVTGFVLASVATLMSTINLIFIPAGVASLNSVLEVVSAIVNGLSGLTTVAATLLLGCAALRTHMLPRLFAWLLILIGILTLPILLLTPLPIGPNWASDTIAFFLSGIGFAAVGLRMLAQHKGTNERYEHKEEASISLMP